jgi:hypothetical protein
MSNTKNNYVLREQNEQTHLKVRLNLNVKFLLLAISLLNLRPEL